MEEGECRLGHNPNKEKLRRLKVPKG